MNVLRTLFTLEGRVPRAQYLAAGLGLAMLKYTVDTIACLVATGEFWDPLSYLSPMFAERLENRSASPWPSCSSSLCGPCPSCGSEWA